MSVIMPRLVAARDAARALEMPYSTLMSKIARGQMHAIKVGPAVFIEKAELAKHADREDMVEAAREVVLPRND